MEEYVTLLIAILITLIAAFAYLAFELSSLKDDVRRMHLTSASEYALSQATTKIITGMNEHFDELLTEIACLATKNNADIQRVREGFRVGDIIEYAGENVLVLERHMLITKDNEELTDYVIWSVTQGVQHETASHINHNAKFIRHVDMFTQVEDEP